MMFTKASKWIKINVDCKLGLSQKGTNHMKKLGLIGGVGPISTIEYYKGINEDYQKQLSHHSKSGENPPMIY